MASAEIGVMVVDDSAVVRQVLGELVSAAPGLRLLATAQDPIIAEQKMLGEWPDVLVLDIEMPRMDGITFLRRIMQKRPTPVLICSSHTEQGARSTLEALAAGAVGVVAKPRLGVRDFLSDSGQDLIQSIREAAASRPRAAGACAARPTATAASPTQTVPRAGTAAQPSLSGRRIVALGTSTGGTQALERVLSALPANAPGLVIVQHMPEHFTSAFADRLNRLCAIEVKEAQHGDRVQVGRALIAPGGRHMRLAGSAGNYRVDVLDGPPINRHKPSVDVLFRSVAQTAGAQAVGVLMTGMGDDGARGLHEMHNCGARTYAQDESSCVVFGMPREAILLGAVDEVLPLDRIGPEIARIPS